MALTHGLDFAIFYACLLALFCYLTLWFVPIAARVVFATVKSWLQRSPRPRAPKDDDPFWFDGHHTP